MKLSAVGIRMSTVKVSEAKIGHKIGTQRYSKYS